MSANGDREREALIQSGIRYARHLATKLSRELPSVVSLDDLVAAANLGLVDAANRYDPSRGAQFTTFAHYRIRGAILDHVRDATAGNAHYRARVSVESAIDNLVEERLGPTVTAVTRTEAALALDALLGEMATVYTLAEIAEETAQEAPVDPESSALAIDRRERLEQALDEIPEREARLLRAVYFEHLTAEQAGAAMGLSKSWSSRLHAKAVASLRARLADFEELL